MDTFMANNKIRISDSQIVLSSQDKTVLLKTVAETVLAQQVNLAMVTLGDAGDFYDDGQLDTTLAKMDDKATRGTPVMVVIFPVLRGTFLYYASAPHNAAQNVVRLGWRYALADWKLYRAIIVPNACEVQRTIDGFFYC